MRITSADFMDYVVADKGTSCLLWAGGCYEQGYGYANVEEVPGERYAHRVAFSLFIGKIPEGLCVCHTCDVRNCVNFGHFFLGTRGDNIRDMFAKKRWGKRSMPGVSHPMAKLSDDDIREIRDSSLTQVKLGELYGVTQAMISCIKLRKNWKHLS